VSAAVELLVDGITHGGEAVGRLPDGKVCFVPYAIPGERVLVEVVDERARWSRGRVLEVLEASPDRVEPPCVYYGEGRCGGCQLQHIAPQAQAALKRRIVSEQLQRIGGIADPPVAETVTVRPFGYRNGARFAVDAGGRLSFRRAGSHELIAIDRCLLVADEAHSVRQEAGDHWEGAEEVVVRAGLRTGDRALVVTPGPAGIPPLPPGETPVALLGTDSAVALRGEPTIVEHAAGRDFRISPTAFFQSNTEAADVLAALVGDAAEVEQGELALDLYAGVGLFTAVLADAGADVIAVESAASAAEDARANSPGVDVRTGDAAAVTAELVAQAEQVDVVVLDPPRKGAPAALCRSIAALGPRVVVYVSCDPAALARDAKVFAGLRYELARAVPVDQFAQTAQIETVATFLPSQAR